MHSGRIFGDRVRGKSRKYLTSQTFTASYPTLDKSKRAGSIALWFLVFACRFVESYFYLTPSFSYPIQVIVSMKIQRCTDRFFGNMLCTNRAAFMWWISSCSSPSLSSGTSFGIPSSLLVGLSCWAYQSRRLGRTSMPGYRRGFM